MLFNIPLEPKPDWLGLGIILGNENSTDSRETGTLNRPRRFTIGTLSLSN